MNRPAGWYRNLDDRRQHGYWNGEAWVDPDDLASPADVLDEIEEGHEIETTVVVEEPQTGHRVRPDDAPTGATSEQTVWPTGYGHLR